MKGVPLAASEFLGMKCNILNLISLLDFPKGVIADHHINPIMKIKVNMKLLQCWFPHRKDNFGLELLSTSNWLSVIYR